LRSTIPRLGSKGDGWISSALMLHNISVVDPGSEIRLLPFDRSSGDVFVVDDEEEEEERV